MEIEDDIIRQIKHLKNIHKAMQPVERERAGAVAPQSEAGGGGDVVIDTLWPKCFNKSLFC